MRIRVAFGLLAGACLLASGTRAMADTPEGVPAPIAITPTAPVFDGDGSVTVLLRNNTATRLDISSRRVEIAVADDAPSSAEPRATVEGRVAVRPGGSRSLGITLHGGDVSDIKSAMLVIRLPPSDAVGDAGFVLRTPIAPHAAVTPSTNKWAMTVRTWGGDDGTVLPLTGRCGDLGLDGEDEVGVVQAAGAQRQVRASCADDDAKSVVLEVTDAGWSSDTYNVLNGTIQLGEGDAGKVELAATMTTGFPVFLLLVVLGVVIAIGCTLWQLRGRAQALLKQEALRIMYMVNEKNPTNVVMSFRKVAEPLGPPFNEWTIAKAVQGECKAIVAEARKADEDAAEEAPEADPKKQIAELEAMVRAWPGVANQLAEVKTYRVDLDVAGAFADAYDAGTSRVDADRGELKIEEVRAIRKVVGEAAEVVRNLEADRVATDLRLVAAYPDAAESKAYRSAVLAVHDAQTIEVLRTAMQKLADASFVLRGNLGPEVDEEEPQLELVDGSEHFALAGGLGTEPQQVFSPDDYDDPMGSGRLLAIRTAAADWFVFLALTASAVVGACVTLWDDKAFGGWVDWASALAWGVASAVITGVVTTAFLNAARSRVAIDDWDEA
jgi:hypothetical protein